MTTHDCAHIRRLEDVSVSVLLCHASPYSLEIRSLLESGAKLAANELEQSSCVWPHSPAFKVDTRVLNLGSQICVASTLSTEPSPQACFCYFLRLRFYIEGRGLTEVVTLN